MNAEHVERLRASWPEGAALHIVRTIGGLRVYAVIPTASGAQVELTASLAVALGVPTVGAVIAVNVGVLLDAVLAVLPTARVIIGDAVSVTATQPAKTTRRDTPATTAVVDIDAMSDEQKREYILANIDTIGAPSPLARSSRKKA